MAYVITEPCIGTKDASCVDVCPVDCIYTTETAPQYYIDPDTCIDCSACEAAVRRRGLRLACQARVQGDVTVTKRGVRPAALTFE